VVLVEGETVRRREFIGLLAGAAGALTCADVFGAEKSPIGRIGLLSVPPLPSDPECNSDRRDNYPNPTNCWLSVDLRALGWREGENLQIAARSCNDDLASLPRLAAELVALRPDVLIAVSSTEAKALQAATSDIPIFFQVSSDPVGYGLVDSIARPGKNITGIALAPQMLWGKRLELLVELLGHRPAKIAWLSDPEDVTAKLNEAAVMQSAETLGIEVERLEVRKADDLDPAFVSAAGSEAVLVKWLGLTYAHRLQIAELAVQHLLPSLYEVGDYVVAGGLMSYGLDCRETLRWGVTYVDRILRGALPRDLPVEQASNFELVINLKTAKAMGVTVPEALLVRADKVIE
jgi:putative tryptophan/tyrosine transport system substrate-binding protein